MHVSKSCPHCWKSGGPNWIHPTTIRPVNKNESRTTRKRREQLEKHAGEQARILSLQKKYKGLCKSTCEIQLANRCGGREYRPGNCIILYQKRRETKRSTNHICIEAREGLVFFRNPGGRFRAFLGPRNAFRAPAKHRFLRHKFRNFDLMDRPLVATQRLLYKFVLRFGTTKRQP